MIECSRTAFGIIAKHFSDTCHTFWGSGGRPCDQTVSLSSSSFAPQSYFSHQNDLTFLMCPIPLGILGIYLGLPKQ